MCQNLALFPDPLVFNGNLYSDSVKRPVSKAEAVMDLNPSEQTH